ncbi:MAG: LysM peptidoglycan-binding domain-containing protein [Defluviitaleaceae bacterium]|nr:LysM peptidoglycan-binding domain-containing protein [Defluviitaleaceae bacterium]
MNFIRSILYFIEVNTYLNGLAVLITLATAFIGVMLFALRFFKSKPIKYEVQDGDDLTKIAIAHDKSWHDVEELYEINRGVIGKNPSSIQKGQILILPRGWKKK